MDGFIIRCTAYHGEPKLVGKLPVRSGISQDAAISNAEIINDPGADVIIDKHAQREVNYTIDSLITDFEDEYGCKINYDDSRADGVLVYEFDVFEPSWPEIQEAQDVISDLQARLVDWVKGHPTGT